MSAIRKFAVIILCSALLLSTQAFAEEARGTREEAQALVKKTIETIKTKGPTETYAAINNKDPSFLVKDIYPIVYDLPGNCLAHGANAKLVGKDLSTMTDINGKVYGKERAEKAKTMDNFWVEYKYKNPVNSKIEPKETYCEKLNETLVCAGVYKVQN